jgi:hypothetical protein
MARRNRLATPEPASPAPLKTRRRSARTQITPPTPEPKPPHKYAWESFTVDCEVGKLVCSFVPGGSHPEGFTGPFQDRFAEYLGLTASVTYRIERQKRKRGTVWVLHYRAREGAQWIEKTEVLKECVTEDEAWLAASRLMRVGPQAKIALVHYLSGEAGQKLLSGLSDALEWALAELINYSCDYVKFMMAVTPQAMRWGEKTQQIGKRQDEETVRLLNEQIQNEVDHDKVKAARRALKYVLEQEPSEWKPFPGFRSSDDDSIAACPPVSATDLRDEALERYRDQLVRRYDITRGGAYKADLRPRREPMYDWKNEENQRAFIAKVEELRPLWNFITAFFKEDHYDADCPKRLKVNSRFQDLSRACTKDFDDLIRKVFDRKNKGGKNLWPKSFALQHAARELDIERAKGLPLKLKTLQTHFDSARKTQR